MQTRLTLFRYVLQRVVELVVLPSDQNVHVGRIRAAQLTAVLWQGELAQDGRLSPLE